MGRSKFVQLQL